MFKNSLIDQLNSLANPLGVNIANQVLTGGIANALAMQKSQSALMGVLGTQFTLKNHLNHDFLKNAIYATVLNGYFKSIKDDIARINKRTAVKYILSPALSDYTKRLYKSVLKAFCEWVLEYQLLESADLSREQKLIKRGLKRISVQSLREVSSLKVFLPRSLTATYHKDSLTEAQRLRLLQLAKKQRDRALLSLMAWNGLRTIEILRLSVSDLKITQGKVSIGGKVKVKNRRILLSFHP